jgi:hypothetical protein
MLSDVTIVITAGSRPGYLRTALHGIRRNLPECKIVVANDDGARPTMLASTIDVIWKELPPDTFLTRKRNEAVKLVDTKYTLMAADDFDFTLDSRAAVIRMAEILDAFQGAEVIAGTYNDRRYEGFLTVKAGEYIKESRLNEKTFTPFSSTQVGDFWAVDIATNWFMARTYVLRFVPWDETIGPIGGEHADWYLSMKENFRTILWTPGLNMYEQPKNREMESPNYRQMRARAFETGHKLMLAKRGVKTYYGFDDEVPT